MALRLGNQSASPGLILGDQAAFTSTADVFGGGVCAAQSATVVGTGVRGVVDIGSLPNLFAQLGVVVGVGKVIHTGAGAMQAQSATVVGIGAGTGLVVGSGALQADQASVSGSGFKGIGGSGVLQAQLAQVVGVGGEVGAVFGAGLLLAGEATVVGAGHREVKSPGTVNLQSGPATIPLGEGTVFALAVNYTAYLKPNSVIIESPSLQAAYPLQFSRGRKQPLSVTVGWEDIVTYHEGHRETLVNSYEFSHDKVFKEEEDSEY